MTTKEKQLTIKLLKEKIERLSGKKVLFKEQNTNNSIEEQINFIFETLADFVADIAFHKNDYIVVTDTEGEVNIYIIPEQDILKLFKLKQKYEISTSKTDAENLVDAVDEYLS